MKYLPEAFAQLEFAWKLWHYGLEGKIDRQSLDIPISFDDGHEVLVLRDQIFDSDDDLLIALENNTLVAFGAAAITLNRAREESGRRLPKTINSEIEQCIGLIYQIRNAFAHDIAEPCWKIRQEKYRRIYSFGGIQVDLSNVHGKSFEYMDIGGPAVFFEIKEYVKKNIFDKP